MCGRFTQAYTWQEVYEFYNLAGPPRNLQPNYNVAPTQTVNVIVSEGGKRLLVDMRWGLIPMWWKKPLKDMPSTFNARLETAAEKPMFRSAFRRSRCVLPASGFYEWKRSGDDKQPYLIKSADGTPMSFAGFWDRWRNPENNEEVVSCTILTTEANSFMSAIHTRMPVMLPPERLDLWLAGAGQPTTASGNDNSLVAHPVDKAVGNVRNNGPELLDPID